MAGVFGVSASLVVASFGVYDISSMASVLSERYYRVLAATAHVGFLKRHAYIPQKETVALQACPYGKVIQVAIT